MTFDQRKVSQRVGDSFDFYVIGDENGYTDEGQRNGFILARQIQGNGLGRAVPVFKGDYRTTPYLPQAGWPVVVEVGIYGVLTIRGTHTMAALALGYDISPGAGGDQTYNGWTQMETATVGLVMPRTPPDTKLTVFPVNWLDWDNQWQGFAGDNNVDLSSAISALSTDERALVLIYMQPDNTIATQVSTAKSGPEYTDPIGLDDLQECQDAIGWVPMVLGAFKIYAGQTAITWADRFGDIRQWIGIRPKYNTTATAAPTVNDDSADGYVVGSRWIDTTNDEEYVCTDSSTGAANWENTTT